MLKFLRQNDLILTFQEICQIIIPKEAILLLLGFVYVLLLYKHFVDIYKYLFLILFDRF